MFILKPHGWVEPFLLAHPKWLLHFHGFFVSLTFLVHFFYIVWILQNGI
jgi:hypothetical protein